MKRRCFSAASAAAVVAMFVGLGSSVATNAQSGSNGPARAVGAMPRMTNGKPDLSGMWVNAYPRDVYQMPIEGSVHITPTRVDVDAKNFKGAGPNVFGNVMN